jgi:hypothetical protein
MTAKTSSQPKSTPPKKGGSLLFPSDPLAAMRELSNLDSMREEAGSDKLPTPEKYTEENTEKNTFPHAEKIADLVAEFNAEIKVDTLTPPHAETNTDKLPSRRIQKRKLAMPQGKAEVHTSNPGTGHSSVRQRIIEDMTKEPVVRKTIDIPASLNDRLQDYCAAKRIKTERRVFLVLLENFLEEEGF